MYVHITEREPARPADVIPDAAISWIALHHREITAGETPAERSMNFEAYADAYYTKFQRDLTSDFRTLALKVE